MKRFLAIFIILALQIATFASLMVRTSFELNKELITQELCVNRSVPESGCEGNCYLRKMTDKTDSQQDSAEYPIRQFQFIALLFSSETLSQTLLLLQESNTYPLDNNDHLKGWPSSTFQPPGTIVQNVGVLYSPTTPEG